MNQNRPDRSSRRRTWATFATALAIIAAGLATASPASAAPVTIDVTAAPYSAAGDGATNDRAAIQAALDDAGANPDGGTVVIPSGSTFLSGGLRIPSHVTLQIEGTLKQSQNPAHYNSDPTTTPPIVQPTPGKFTTSGIMYDQLMFHNDPFVLSWGTTDAALTGDGTIEMTWTGSQSTTLHLMAIGFLNAVDFLVEDVTVIGGRAYNVAIYGSTSGVVRNLDIDSANIVNTDGISVVNSQHVLVEGNTLDVYDDGLYAVTRFNDPRDYDPDSWWSNRTRQASSHVEFASNHVVSTTRGFMFRGVVNGVSDLREVETTDLYVHDNYFDSANPAPVSCWATSQPAPMARYTFADNTYVGGPPWNVEAGGQCLITDFVNDFQVPSYPSLLNRDFETTGDAWWSPTGGGGVHELGDPSSPLVAAAQTAAASFGGAGSFIGYLQDYGTGTASLVQGLGLGPVPIPSGGTPLPTPIASSTRYDLSATIQTSGDPVRLVAIDSCTGATLGARTVSAATPTVVTMPFIVGSGCGNIRVGIDSLGASTGWALVDTLELQRPVIDDTDTSHVSYSGTWNQFANTPALDIQGTRTVGYNVGDSVTLTFSGKRAWLYGVRSANSGIVSITVDGAPAGSVDAYAATTQQAQLLFDTGELAWGDHTIVVTISGKNPSASLPRFGLDALLVDRIIDDNDLAIVSYSGSWGLYTNTPTLDVKGTRHVGTTAGSHVTIPFDGSGVAIYGSTGPALGTFAVYLDGAATPVATVDPYATSITQGIPLWRSGSLTPGPHTVRIEVTGVASPASSGIRIGFDAILVD